MRARTPICSLWLVLGSVFLSPSFGSAQQPNAPSEVAWAECRKPWSLRVIPYLWAPGFDGDLTGRGVTAPVDVSVGKVLDILWNEINVAALGQIEINNDKCGIIFNGIYVDVSPGQVVRRVNFADRFRIAIFDTTITRELEHLPALCRLPEASRLEVLAGVRYYSLSARLTVTGPRGNSVMTGGTEDWQDAIIGARLRVPLGRCLTAQVRGDIGGFDIGEASQFAWNIEAILEYRCSERCSLFAGYRWLDIDYTSGSGNRTFGFDMNLSGPLMGFAIDF